MSTNKFLPPNPWTELSDALSAEHLKQSGMGNLKPNASVADADFKKLRKFLNVEPKTRRSVVSQKIIKKLA
jgi:hypothetical protein